jgi:hypothetical protein
MIVPMLPICTTSPEPKHQAQPKSARDHNLHSSCSLHADILSPPSRTEAKKPRIHRQGRTPQARASAEPHRRACTPCVPRALG